MNIVSSTASATPITANPMAARPDGSTTDHVLPDAGDGGDVGVQGGASPTAAFGSMLSKHLSEAPGDGATGRARGILDGKAQLAGAGGGDQTEGATGIAPPVDDRATAADAASDIGAVVPQGLFPTLAGATGKTTEGGTSDSVSRKTRAAAEDRTSDGDVGSDLAAQLALAAQWTGAAMPADPASPVSNTAAATTAVATTGSGSGIDTRSPFGNERALPGNDERQPTRGAATPASPAARTAAAPADTAVEAPVGSVQVGLAVIKSLSGKDPAGPVKDAVTTARGGATLVDAAPVTSSQTSSSDSSTADTGRRDAPGTPVVAAKETDAGTRSDPALAVDTPTAGTTTGMDTVSTTDAFAQRLAIHAAGATATAGSVGATAASSASAAPGSFAYVQEPVGSSGWSHEVGQATLRMAANDLQSASIRLNPEHLGPLDVQVRVENGIAHVAFNATHVDTRQALEASRGTLDQLFTNQGLKMGDVSVGSGASGGAHAGSGDSPAARGDASADASRRDSANRWSGDDAANDSDAPVMNVTTRIARALGLVDTFA